MKANKYTGEVSLDIHGIEYFLVYDWEALAYIKSMFTDEELDGILQGQRVDGLEHVIYAGLKKRHADITPEEIKSLSPPYVDTIVALTHGIKYAYYGYGGKPDTQKKTPLLKKLAIALLKHTVLLSISVYALLHFGVLLLGNFPFL